MYFVEKHQHLGELNEFIGLLVKENVRSFLEIGSQYGGSLWHIGQALPKGSRLVAVDKPYGDPSHPMHSLQHLVTCIASLQKQGHNTHLIVGDSTNFKTIERVKALGPFDCVFIDGNHTLPYLMLDWANYGPMTRMVAFHDIGYDKPWKTNSIDVKSFWNELKLGYRHIEIRQCEANNGIGVLWQ